MFQKINMLSFFQSPTCLTSFALTTARNSILWYKLVIKFFSVNIGHRKVVRIFRNPVAPSTKHYA